MRRGFLPDTMRVSSRIQGDELSPDSLSMNPHNSAISCENLSKSFGSQPVLNDVDLQVAAGTITAVLGSNGAGKTTLLKILSSLIVPSGGQASICGHDVAKRPEMAKRMIGFAPAEERSFYWRLSGTQNLAFFAALHQMDGRFRIRRIQEVLSAVGLEAEDRRRFSDFSSGMKQALGLARAILHDPPVLILDEPTRSLSPDRARHIRSLLRTKAVEEGKAILLASHNLNEVVEVADHLVILHEGVIRLSGTPSGLSTQMKLPPSAELETIFTRITNGH